MKKEYDKAIAEHYKSVAAAEGLSSTSTMADEIIRKKETEAILGLMAAVVASKAIGTKLSVADIGCGNGFTIEQLALTFSGHDFMAVEKTDSLRALAETRLASRDNVRVLAGDIRDPAFLPAESLDVLVCQRVLINLLDRADQDAALVNIMGTVRPGGVLLFIESFEQALTNLNRARAEFEMEPIPPAHHNLYLAEDYFFHSELLPFQSPLFTIEPNFLSSHYFVTRVLHPVLLGSRPFVRNSDFARFFSVALPPVGNYAPLQLRVFIKKAT